mmetsp:Transcript_8348/g.8651  ORF Transcript_8348/g.8651 Transcript_8348/m.8651 type:complete len:261 (+) Transcript_8348:1346-2128(+)
MSYGSSMNNSVGLKCAAPPQKSSSILSKIGQSIGGMFSSSNSKKMSKATTMVESSAPRSMARAKVSKVETESLSTNKKKKIMGSEELKMFCMDEGRKCDSNNIGDEFELDQLCCEMEKDYDIKEAKYKSSFTPKTSTTVSKSSSSTVKQFSSFDNELYNLFIQSQSVEGIWRRSGLDNLKVIESNYQERRAKIEAYLKDNNVLTKDLFTLEDVVQTIIVLLILAEKYSSKQEEHKLIVNKSLKSLNKVGVNYQDVVDKSN